MDHLAWRALLASSSVAIAVAWNASGSMAADPNLPLGAGDHYLQYRLNEGTRYASAGKWAFTNGRFDSSAGVLTYDFHLDLTPASGFSSGPVAVFWTLRVSGALPGYGDIESAWVDPGLAAAGDPRCRDDGRCAVDLVLQTPTAEAVALAKRLSERGDERVGLDIVFTVIRSLGAGSVLQVITPGADGGLASAGTLPHPENIRGRFFRQGFNPIDRDFGNSSDGVRPMNLLTMYLRAISNAGMTPTDGRSPEWRAVVMDLEVAGCYNARALVANDATDATMVLDIPNEGHQHGVGVVPAGEGWKLTLSSDNEWNQVLPIPSSFESVVITGFVNCEDRDPDGLRVSDGGPREANPPRLRALPATDRANTAGESALPTGWAPFSAVLGASVWLLRRRGLTFGP